MVKKEIKSIILYLDSAVAIDYLTDEQAGILFKAVLRYGRNGQMLESSDNSQIAVDVVNVYTSLSKLTRRNWQLEKYRHKSGTIVFLNFSIMEGHSSLGFERI